MSTTSTKKNDVKPGIVSTEFYVAIAGIIGPLVAGWLDKLSASESAWIAGGVAAVYAMCRSIVKATAK